MYDTVFVFKEFRLAYKCIGEYNTFKVKLINLLVGSFVAIISRFFLGWIAFFCMQMLTKTTGKINKLNCTKYIMI